jgi:DNA-binding MarR family transcriptional regulator
MELYYTYNAATSEMGLSATAYKVYHFLAKHAKNGERTSYCAKGTMAAAIGVSLSTIYRAIKELQCNGLLKVSPRYRGRGERSSNLYTLTDTPTDQLKLHPTEQEKAVAAGKMQHMDAPVHDTDASGNAMKLYCYFKKIANRKGVCYAYLKEIANALQCSVRSIQRYAAELLQKGLLSITRAAGGKNTYRIKNAANASQNEEPASPKPPRKKKKNKMRPKKQQRTREQCALLEAETQQFLAELADKQEAMWQHRFLSAVYRILFLKI